MVEIKLYWVENLSISPRIFTCLNIDKRILSRIFFSPHCCSIKVSGLQQSDSVMSLWDSCYAVTIWYQDNYDDCQEITPITIMDKLLPSGECGNEADYGIESWAPFVNSHYNPRGMITLVLQAATPSQPQPQSIAGLSLTLVNYPSNICQHLEKENLKPIYGSLLLHLASWCNNNKIAENYTFQGNFLQPD